MNAKELFKKLVRDAKERNVCAPNRSIMSYGSQSASDFEIKRKTNGRFSHLTDEFIDGLSDEDLEMEMVCFIYRCFQQR